MDNPFTSLSSPETFSPVFVAPTEITEEMVMAAARTLMDAVDRPGGYEREATKWTIETARRMLYAALRPRTRR